MLIKRILTGQVSFFATNYNKYSKQMKLTKLSIAAVFLTAFTPIAAQQTDSLKTEKRIEGVVIQGTTNKGAEANLINTQRRSLEVIERVGSAQLEKQGVGDVSTAVTKATGAQKQEGSGQVFIRGLGDRSNSTQINGLAIPSNDPMYKNLDLSLLKTDMIDYVGLEKVYHPKMWGDMSGANINIVTKVYTGKPYFKINLGSSISLNAVNTGTFSLQDGLNYFGFDTPSKPKNAALVNSGFAFTTSANNQQILNPINSSLSVDFGRNWNIGQGRLSIFGYGSFENQYQYLEGTTGGSYDAHGSILRIYDTAEEFGYDTNTTALVNLNYRLNPRHTVNFSTNFIHTTDQKLGLYEGFDRNYLDDPQREQGYTTLRRASTKVNDLLVSQLRGDHTLSESLKLSWNLGLNLLESQRPDRQQNASVFDKATGTSYFASSNPGANHRYFDRLKEKDYVGSVQLEYEATEKLKLQAGLESRFKDSDFRATQYNFRVTSPQGNYYLDPNSYDSFFNLDNYQTGSYFDIVTFRGDIRYNPENALIPQFYQAEMFNNAAFANLNITLNQKLSAQVGVRYDNLQQEIRYNTAIFSNGGEIKKDYSKILPALNVKYALDSKHNLRFSASKTYTTPLLLEIAPYEYEEIDELSYGNIDLYPSDNYNVDLKWEWFPRRNELVSLTAFGKLIQNPIARITASSSANTTSFANVGDQGQVFGAEFEARKDLLNLGQSRLYTFLNLSYIHTSQELDKEKVIRENSTVTADFIRAEDKMTGASDLLANVNLGWERKLDTGAQLDLVASYSYISDNVYALGYEMRGNIVDKAIHTLDAVAKYKTQSGIGISLSAKNLLNPTFHRVQDNTNAELTVRKYQLGAQLGAGVSYEF